MNKADTTRHPITLSHLADAVANGMSSFARLDAAPPQSVHIVRKPQSWTVIVKIGAFEWCKNVADRHETTSRGDKVEQWVEGEISVPLAAALAAHLHSASRGQ